MRKSAFCICEDKGAEQIISAFVMAIEDITLVVISYEIYQTSLRLLG